MISIFSFLYFVIFNQHGKLCFMHQSIKARNKEYANAFIDDFSMRFGDKIQSDASFKKKT